MTEEDKYLSEKEKRVVNCIHEWCDMYAGAGVDEDNINTQLQAFFCNKCLEIRVKAWSAVRYAKKDEIDA